MVKKLIDILHKSNNKLFIQTHDFPDPDAIASAYGLHNFLKLNNVESTIIYCGEIQRTALQKMVLNLGIKIFRDKEVDISPNDYIIIVDGCKGSQNVTDLPGYEIAVIDHHIVKKPEDVPYIQIEDNIGSCSTLITEYYMKDSISIPENCATALMVGISRDTDMLTRKVTERDIEAYHYLYKFSDNNTVNSILRNNIQLSDFDYFNKAINNLNKNEKTAWCYFEEGCSTNLMGIIGDFILSAQEINFCIIFSKNNNSISISIRNERLDINAANVAKKITNGIGAGGGHKEMAGGVIYNSANFDLDKIITKIKSVTK